MIIKFAFYKPQSKDWFGQTIAWYTRIFNWSSKNYAHVEIGIPFEDGTFKWYSSASKNTNGKSGTRWIEESILFEHPERWDIYNVPNLIPINEMINIANSELGKAYDWWGIFGFITITGLENSKNKWYCSEICQKVYSGKWIKRVSPERLYNMIKDKVVKNGNR